MNNIRRSALVLIFFFASVQIANAQVTNQRLFDTLPFLVEHYAKRTAMCEQEPVVTNKIIFLGNSITEGGPWAELTGDSSVVNRGIGGDITITVLKRLDDVIIRKPSKLFILIGINDIAKDIPDAVIADNVRKIIERVKSGSPTTSIYLQSILPLNPTVKNFPQHYDKQPHVDSTNKLLKRAAASSGVTYIDISIIFYDKNHNLDPALSPDGLHLNRQGYDRWYAHLKKLKALD